MNAQERERLAGRWKCSDRTIKRWSRQNAPFGDDGKMRSWLAARKNVPPAYASTVGTGVLERAILMRRQGYLSPVQLAELGNEVDLQIHRSVARLHELAGELVGKTKADVEARLLQAEQEIFKSCLCLITDRIELV